LRAIALGTGAPDLLDIPYLPNSADIEEGDLLTSSGLGGRFPRDYPVAKVTTVVKDPSKPYAVVKAKPTALLETSREVLLVWSQEAPRSASPDDQEDTTTEALSSPETAPGTPKPGTRLDTEANDGDAMAGVNP
jgi:rod shape-determining protein MreC